MSNVRYLEAPENFVSKNTDPLFLFKVFLAGGITGVPDWQSEVVAKVRLIAGYSKPFMNTPAPSDILLMNPRRANFPMDDPKAARQQIEWEFHHLRTADVLSFWFAAEAIQPITLFEYGYWLGQNKPLIVGCDPNYPRRQDVLIQTGLARPGLPIYSNLDSICSEIVYKAC